ncbi:MAG: hypothetical protein ACJAZ3_000839 [Sphingobacteriales bacterium]|jgi:hypothetical protein
MVTDLITCYQKLKNNNMKKVYYIIGLATIGTSVFVASCNWTNNREVKNAQLSALEADKRLDSLTHYFEESMAEINNNVKTIHEQHGVIILGPNATDQEQTNARDRVVANIDVLSDLMIENRQKLDEMEERLRKFGAENSQLYRKVKESTAQLLKKEEMIQSMREQIVSRETDIQLLGGELDKLTASLAQVMTMNDSLKNKVEAVVTVNHTAYYTVGNNKELLEREIIAKEGGVLGLGRTAVLNESFDNKYFKMIDTRTTSHIPINSKNVKLITEHPESSYTLHMNKETETISYLEITNPDRFWRANKYLVAELK